MRDRQAFAELIDRYQRPLRYFVTRLIGNPDLAEEFCQETWLTVLGKIHTLRDELLKQNGGSSQRERELRDMTLARDEKRVKRMKQIAAISWVTFLIFFFLSVFIEIMRRHSEQIVGVSAQEIGVYFAEFDWFVPAAIIVTQALFIIAVALTFSLYARSRTLTIHQIQARLSHIEEHLKKMADKE